MTANWVEARRALDAAGLSRLRTGQAQNVFVRQMRNEPTPAEALLWGRVSAKQLGLPFRRQRTILQYVVDFYCPATGLAVEVDGGYHGSSQEQVAYESKRDAEIRALGVTILRFTNERVLGHLEDVVREIKAQNEYLGVHRPLQRRFLLVNGRTKNPNPARQCSESTIEP